MSRALPPVATFQRRFKVGYNRAASIIEMMGEDGLVGLPKGAGKPRDFIQGQGALLDAVDA
jgi:S-DNA-T family DNA segregation ATPase FtsK/SpoIIIE